MVFKFGRSFLAATIALSTFASGLAYTSGVPAAIAASSKQTTTKVASTDKTTAPGTKAKTTKTKSTKPKATSSPKPKTGSSPVKKPTSPQK